MSLNRQSEALRLTPKIALLEAFKERVANSHATVDTNSVSAVKSNSSGGGNGKGKIQVVELLKLTKTLRDIFGPVEGQYGEYLTSSEVRQIDSSYTAYKVTIFLSFVLN